MTRHALGAQRLPPDVALRTIDSGLQAHRDVLDPCSIELGREGKQSMRDSIEHNEYSSYIGTEPPN